MEQRENIKFCVELEKKFAETYELMEKVHGDDCMSRTQVYTWFTRFKNGREDLNDGLRPCRPEVSNRAKLVEKFREIIDIDAKFTTRMLAEELNMSKNTIWRILTEDLGKRKVCARFVLHQLNAPPYTTKKLNKFFINKRFSLINHPPYSPDLSPCDIKKSMHALVDRSKCCIESNGTYFD